MLFPEGTRKEGATIGPLHDGAMFVAARTGAMVVPVGIAGSEQAMPVGREVSAIRQDPHRGGRAHGAAARRRASVALGDRRQERGASSARCKQVYDESRALER